MPNVSGSYHPKTRTILFVDGENMLLRFEDSMRSGGFKITEGAIYKKDQYLWHPNLISQNQLYPFRAHYYSTAVGDEDSLENLRNEISCIDFHTMAFGKHQKYQLIPRIFKKEKRSTKTKSVDINLVTDILRYAHSRSVDQVVVVSGDGDFIPVYEEVQRLGITVTVMAFSNGLNKFIKPRVDSFFDLDPFFLLPN